MLDLKICHFKLLIEGREVLGSITMSNVVLLGQEIIPQVMLPGIEKTLDVFLMNQVTEASVYILLDFSLVSRYLTI